MPEFPALLLLEVTQDHINRGKGGDGEACAMAVALKEQTGADNAEVTSDLDIAVYAIDPETEATTKALYAGPKSINAFLDRFDAVRSDGEASTYRVDVKPTVFRLKRQALFVNGTPVT